MWTEGDSYSVLLTSLSADCCSPTTTTVGSHRRTVWWTSCWLSQHSYQLLPGGRCLPRPEPPGCPGCGAPSPPEGKFRSGLSSGENTVRRGERGSALVTHAHRVCTCPVQGYGEKVKEKMALTVRSLQVYGITKEQDNGVRSLIREMTQHFSSPSAVSIPVQPFFFSVIFSYYFLLSFAPNCSPLGSTLAETVPPATPSPLPSLPPCPGAAHSTLDTVTLFFFSKWPAVGLGMSSLGKN